MLCLVYLLLTLNITISLSNAVYKQAFFRLKMATIVVLNNYFYKRNSDYDYNYDYNYDHVME